MKKLLALVLALVMSMSLVTISNAAFSDAKDIEYTEAVEVMNALGVINGLPDGSFGAKDSVTRAQMAKMITIISIGDIDPAAFVGTVTDLTDINGHWAEGYIKYCYSQGIIAGTGAGKFEPDAKVTAAQAAKMLLVALGYNSDVQGYTGAQWSINVARDAQLKGFYKDLSVSSLAVLTREQAAQMMYNAVNAKVITESKTLNSDGTVSTHYSDGSKNLLETTFNADTDKDQLTKVSYNNDKKEFTYTVGGDTFTTTADFTDLYRQNVKVLSKTENGKTTVYGIYADDSSVVVSAPYYQVSAGSKDGEMKIDGTVYKIDAAATTLTNYYPTAYDTDASAAVPAGASVAAMVKFIDNDNDGDIDFGVYTPFTVAEVSYAGVKSFTVDTTPSANYKYEDQDKTFTLADKVEKDDQVMVVAAANSFVNKVEISKLDVLSGKVVATNGITKSKIGETWYKHAASALALDSEYDYAVVNGYVVYNSATTSSVKADEYVVLVDKVEAANNGFNGNQIKVLKTDGTTEIVGFDTATGSLPISGSGCVAVGTLYTMKDKDSDGKYELYAVETTADANGKVGGFDGVLTSVSYSKASDKAGKIGGNDIADDAVVFVYNGDSTDPEYKVITGDTLKKTSTASTTAVTNAYYNSNKSTGFDTVVLAYVTSSVASTSDVKYGYVVADVITEKDTDSNSIDSVTFWNGSENVTLYTDKNNDGVLTAKGQAFSYKLDEKGNMTEIAKITADKEHAITKWNGSKLGGEGWANTYDVDDDTVIIYVDTDAKTGVDGGAITLANEDSTPSHNLIKNVLTWADSDGDIVYLFVDIANDYQYVA